MPFSPVGPAEIFTCKKCGECCKGFGGTYVAQKDILAISEYIRTDPDQFTEKFCLMSGNRPVIATGENGYCVFWDRVCTIHPVKPRMCKAWPFIKSVLIDVENWHIMAGFCPGMRTDIRNEVIQACVREILENSG